MTLVRFFTLALFLGLVLTACGTSPSASDGVTQPPAPTAPLTQATGAAPAQDLARTDDQGAVTLVFNPVNLNNPDQTLDFEVTMDTHSVDLSMDLVALATLTTDSGRSVRATWWDAPRGGHHVEGKLSFPASVDGVSLLEGAATVTLIVRDVDVPQRVFVWELAGQ